MLAQRTIRNKTSASGVGLHTGKRAILTLHPADPNTGIIFKRIDLNEPNEIVPDIYNVSSAVLCTTISNNNGAKISLTTPETAVSPGQACVFYCKDEIGTRLLGGGWIHSTN